MGNKDKFMTASTYNAWDELPNQPCGDGSRGVGAHCTAGHRLWSSSFMTTICQCRFTIHRTHREGEFKTHILILRCQVTLRKTPILPRRTFLISSSRRNASSLSACSTLILDSSSKSPLDSSFSRGSASRASTRACNSLACLCAANASRIAAVQASSLRSSALSSSHVLLASSLLVPASGLNSVSVSDFKH